MPVRIQGGGKALGPQGAGRLRVRDDGGLRKTARRRRAASPDGAPWRFSSALLAAYSTVKRVVAAMGEITPSSVMARTVNS